MDWEKMPQRQLSCYVAMLPVIKAEEALGLYQSVACGTGGKSKRQATQIRRQINEWIKTTRRYSGSKVRRPKNPEDMKAMLASLGIQVKEVPRKRG